MKIDPPPCSDFRDYEEGGYLHVCIRHSNRDFIVR
jgi:hypothetical protein